VLYQTVVEYKEDEGTKAFDFTAIMVIIGNFISLCVVSSLFGIIMGLVITYIFKRCRFLSHSAVQETFLILCWAWLTYYLSEVFGQSGITSLVAVALVMAHYAWFNLSPQGKHVTHVAFQTFGYAAEAFVFSFIGLSVMYYSTYPYSWKLILAEFFIVIIGRFSAIVMSYYMFECVKGDGSNKLTFNEISFLTYAALIRGAIAFGLVENLSEHILVDHETGFNKKDVIVSTVFVLVVTSTFIFGGLTPVV